MAITDYLAEQTLTLNPTQTRCHCGKSVVLPRHPTIHCPRCHRTYQARTLHYPVNCPACDFNLRVWRQRNGIQELFGSGREGLGALEIPAQHRESGRESVAGEFVCCLRHTELSCRPPPARP